MEPQERELITTLLTRLQSAASAGQPKDPEADQLIRQAVAQMPDASYYLVQTVLIQDLSLHNAQNRIAELEKQVASLPPPQQQQPTSFLGGLFGRSQSQPALAPSVPQSGGPWTRVQQPAAPPPQYAQPGYAQPGYAPQPGYAQPAAAGGVFGAGAGAGGGFLRSAAATAAGVAGGALLFEGISSLFGHNYASGLGGFGGMGGGMPGGLGETVINNYYGDGQEGGSQGGFAGGGDGGYAGGDSGYAGGGGDGGYTGGGGDGDYDGGGDSDGGGWDSSGGGDDFGGGDSGGGDSFNC
jgi:uncharacterized protein